jgi:hypothetical protein
MGHRLPGNAAGASGFVLTGLLELGRWALLGGTEEPRPRSDKISFIPNGRWLLLEATRRRGRRRSFAWPPPSGSVSYFFLLFLFFFLFFLLFLATYITPLHDPVGQRTVDRTSTYH